MVQHTGAVPEQYENRLLVIMFLALIIKSHIIFKYDDLYTFLNVLCSLKDSAADGATISWKENFDLAYAELHEIGR